MPTSPNNTVTLNGKAYAILGPVRQQPASDFQAGLRIGSPQYDDRQGAFILTLEDPSGGLGILASDERKNEHMRPRYATAETRFPKLFTLPALVNTVDLSAIATVSMPTVPVGKLRQWKDVLLIAVGDKMFKLKSDLSVTNITPTNFATEVGAAARTADLLIHDFNDGLFANAPAILWGLSGTGANGQYYIAAASDPVSASWAVQDSDPAEELISMVSFDQKVLKIQGAVMKESNEGTVNTWGDLAVTPFDQGTFMEVPLNSNFIGTHRVPFGPDFMPWLLLQGEGGYQGKIAPLDYWARQFKPLELNIGRISAAYMLDEGVLVSNTYDVYKVIPSDPPTLRPMGIRKQQGLPPEMAGAIVSGLGSVGGEPLVGMTNLKTGGEGRVWLLQHNGAGWHIRAELALDGAIVLDIFTYEAPASLFGFRSAPYICWTTWDGTTCRLHYIQEPLGYGSPEQDPTYEYATSGVYETPWLYGGQEDLFGALLRLRVQNGRLSANETITVKYRLDLDDTSAWTPLGTFNSSTRELEWGANGEGLEWESVRFRFEFARGGTATTAPLCRAFVLLYDKKPVTRRSYLFNVDAARMIEENTNPDNAADLPWPGFDATLTFKEILNELVTAKDTYPLVAFTYDDEPTRYVKVIGLPSTETQIHSSKRRGVIQVQVAELIGG